MTAFEASALLPAVMVSSSTPNEDRMDTVDSPSSRCQPMRTVELPSFSMHQRHGTVDTQMRGLALHPMRSASAPDETRERERMQRIDNAISFLAVELDLNNDTVSALRGVARTKQSTAGTLKAPLQASACGLNTLDTKLLPLQQMQQKQLYNQEMFSTCPSSSSPGWPVGVGPWNSRATASGMPVPTTEPGLQSWRSTSAFPREGVAFLPGTADLSPPGLLFSQQLSIQQLSSQASPLVHTRTVTATGIRFSVTG